MVSELLYASFSGLFSSLIMYPLNLLLIYMGIRMLRGQKGLYSGWVDLLFVSNASFVCFGLYTGDIGLIIPNIISSIAALILVFKTGKQPKKVSNETIICTTE